jgi:putative hydrolase of the HAD superfamily
LSGDEAWRRVAEALGFPDEAAGQRLCRRVLGPWETIHPVMRDLVHSLKGRYRLAVISNTYEKDFADTFGKRYGLPDHFGVIVSSAAVGITKPDPRIYALTLERLGVQAGEALFVDDNPKLAEGARTAGLAAIHFVNPESLLAELKTVLDVSPA